MSAATPCYYLSASFERNSFQIKGADALLDALAESDNTALYGDHNDPRSDVLVHVGLKGASLYTNNENSITLSLTGHDHGVPYLKELDKTPIVLDSGSDGTIFVFIKFVFLPCESPLPIWTLCEHSFCYSSENLTPGSNIKLSLHGSQQGATSQVSLRCRSSPPELGDDPQIQLNLQEEDEELPQSVFRSLTSCSIS